MSDMEKVAHGRQHNDQLQTNDENEDIDERPAMPQPAEYIVLMSDLAPIQHVENLQVTSSKLAYQQMRKRKSCTKVE